MATQGAGPKEVGTGEDSPDVNGAEDDDDDGRVGGAGEDVGGAGDDVWGVGAQVEVRGGLQDGGVAGAAETTMEGFGGSFVTSLVSTATGDTAVGGVWTRAGVWDRLGRARVPEAEVGGVFFPGTDDWTRGDRGRDFGGAGDGGRFLDVDEALPSGRVL